MGSIPTTFSRLNQVYSDLLDLTPHIEERALRFVSYNTVLSPRVTTMTDMDGFNTRAISEYLRNRRAVQLTEATEIPDAVVKRVRKSEIAPLEWGDSYPISDRRAQTDLENILTDVVVFLADSLGKRQEKELFSTLRSAGTGSNAMHGTRDITGATDPNFSLDYLVDFHTEFFQQGWTTEPLYLVVHPYQTRAVKKDLIDLSNGSDPAFRDAAIASWTLPSFSRFSIVESPLVPRKVTYKMAIDVSGG